MANMNRTQAFQQLKRNKKRLKHGDKKALQQSKQALHVIMATEGEEG